MRNRLLSLFLVVVMLFGICVTTASCAQLEQFIGYENLGDDYINTYYPDGIPGVEDETPDDGGETPDDGGETPDDGGETPDNGGETPDNGGETPDGGDEKPGEDTEVCLNEHASYAKREEGYNLVTFYWRNSLITDYSDCDLWAWWDGGGGGAFLWEKCEYGGRVTLSIPEEVTEVGFIARKYCTMPGDGTSWGNAEKDTGADDCFATVTGPDTFIFLKGGGDSNQYSSNDGGKTLKVIQKFNLASISDLNTIEYAVTPAVKLSRLSQVKVYDGDREIKVTGLNTLNRSSANGKITIDETLDITKTYTLVIEGYGEQTVVPTDIFDTDWFAENYHYDGTDLGSTINGDGTTTFKVWAPTASKVVLNLYQDGKKGVSTTGDFSVDMIKGDKGVWSYTTKVSDNIGHGSYYTYSVTTAVGTQEAVDPYAKAAGVNGNRGMVIDLSLTNPEGWEEDVKNFSTGIDSYSDAIIWEIHVKDFSNTIEGSQYKGKYLAFTEKGLVNENGIPVGIDYLKALGVNYVHILPSYDYATVDADYLGEEWKEKFNWGYDPKNYNVPEGSYSTNPYDGEVRIKEYKEMVMALHEAGIGVVMDVVYNHTYDKNACFNMIVPYYYYRYKSNGANSSGSGCGNDTASERYMYGKFMVESVSYWQQEYNLDGFRFDLMGLHDMKTMQKIESVVHNYDPTALIYGEGWTMMQNAYTSTGAADQKNIGKIVPTNGAIGTIAVFNDVIRVGLKGEDNDASKGLMNGNLGNANDGRSTRDKVIFGVLGGNTSTGSSGWRVKDMVVNYMSAHDGSTIWDKLSIANGNTDINIRLKMYRLGATIIMTSRGIAFMQAGEEMLRSKPNSKDPNGYDRNSYSSSDEVNNLKWDNLKEGSNEYAMMQYYAGLIDIRKTFGVFSGQDCTSFNVEKFSSGYIIHATTADGGSAVVVVNPKAYADTYNLPAGDYYMIGDGVVAGTDKLSDTIYNGSVKISGYSAYIFVNQQLLNSSK